MRIGIKCADLAYSDQELRETGAQKHIMNTTLIHVHVITSHHIPLHNISRM